MSDTIFRAQELALAIITATRGYAQRRQLGEKMLHANGPATRIIARAWVDIACNGALDYQHDTIKRYDSSTRFTVDDILFAAIHLAAHYEDEARKNL